MATISHRVEQLRQDRGWTKAELARRTGLHQQQIYKVLARDRKRMDAQTIMALARAFRVTTDTLLGMEEPEDGSCGIRVS